MNETTKKHQELIRDLIVKCLIDHPEDLSVLPREDGRGKVFWTVQGHADDYRKICGARGAHVKALTLLVEEIGECTDGSYHFWLKESEEGTVRPMKIVEPREDYDPRDASDLLTRVLRAAAGREDALSVTTYSDGSRLETPPFAMVFRFEITPAHPDVADWMTDVSPSASPGISVLSAVQTLWRAYGAKNGAAFQVVLKS